MKRLISLLLVICMLVPCFAFAEQFDDSVLFESSEDVFADVPDEMVQDAVDEDLVLPEMDDLIIMPTVEDNGPDPYNRELVLLQPTDLNGVTLAVDKVRLSWSPVAFATQYDVYRKNIGETDYTKIASTPASQTYFEDASIVPGTVVYYRVQAANVSYDGTTPVVTYSPQSNTLPYITMDAPKLNDPRGLDATTVRLTWTPSAGATTYEVEISNAVDGTYTESRKGLTGSLCNVADLKAGTGYFFRVRAVRIFSSGEKFYSEYSNIGCGTPMERPSLSVTADNNNAVLSWSSCAGATGYVIYRKVGTEIGYSKLAVVGDVTSYVDANRVPGETCYYFVYAQRPVGSYNCFSLSSETRYFTIVEPVELCAVQNTGAQEQTIDWISHATGANRYLVYASTSMSGIYTQIGETDQTTFVAKNLESGKTYFYKVRAIRVFSNGDVCYGPWSNTMSMPEAGTLQLSNLTATNTTFKAQYGYDISGGYVGDIFTWNVTASGGSGAYSFKYSLVSLDDNSAVVLKPFSEGYTKIEEGKTSLVDTFSLTLTDEYVDLITNKQYAMQVEVRDSEGAVAAMYACGDTYAEMNFAAARPTTKVVNVTMRAGEKLTLEHGIFTEAGDKLYMDVSNPTNAIVINPTTYEITAYSNGYATVLITPMRFENDVLIAYNITVGYAELAINAITPSATVLNNYETLQWDIKYTGGRPSYTVNFKVYRDTTLVASETYTKTNTGTISVNYPVNVAGNYSLEVTINSADSQTVTRRSAVTKVVSYNPVTILPSVTTTQTGKAVTWVTSYSGANTVVRRDYTLFRDGAVVASSVGTNDFSFTFTPTVAGSYVLKVIVYENTGNRIDVTSSTVTVAQGVAGSTKGVVNAAKVALRKGDGTQYSVIMRIDKGKTVNVIAQKGDWYYVEYNGHMGYMMAQYITMK